MPIRMIWGLWQLMFSKTVIIVDAIRTWASDGNMRTWSDRVKSSPQVAQRAVQILTGLTLRSSSTIIDGPHAAV